MYLCNGCFLCFQMDSVLYVLHVYNINLLPSIVLRLHSMLSLSHGRHGSAEKLDVAYGAAA